MERALRRAVAHRMRFLRTAEKQRVCDLIEDRRTLLSLNCDELSKLAGRPLRVTRFNPGELLNEAEQDVAICERMGIRLVCTDDESYPPLLRETYAPPYLLFVRDGKQTTALGSLKAAAIVGTRGPDARAEAAARELAAGLVRQGVPVVSGLAVGIDAAAHRGALDAAWDADGGETVPTIAVLGNGIDEIYPRGHKRLAGRILRAGGLLVSEYPPGIPPARYTFPERNRIIAGLCSWTVIVQAPFRSGALITADHALDEGREVLVHGHGFRGERGAGTRALAGEGAPVVLSARHVLEEEGRPCSEEFSEFHEPCGGVAGSVSTGSAGSSNAGAGTRSAGTPRISGARMRAPRSGQATASAVGRRLERRKERGLFDE